MPLSEPRRAQLDGIVRQMIQNKETDDDIQFVVNDFSKKYQGENQIQQPPSRTFGQNVKEVAVGAGKGVISTLKGAADLGQKILEPFAPASNLPGKPTDIIPKQTYTPSNMPQKIGFGVEQVGEFLLPASKVAKAGKVFEVAKGAGKLARVGSGAAKLGLEAGAAGGQVAIQEGEVGKEAVIGTAAVGGLGVGVKAASSVLRKVPATAWSILLKRTSSQVAKNPNLPEQAAATGLGGLSKQGIINKAGNVIQQVEIALDDLLKGSNEKIGTLKIAPYLDKLRTAYKNIPGEEGSVETINKVMSSFLKKKSLTPLEANQLKRGIYQNIANSYGKGILESPVKIETQKQIARGLKSEIEKVIPETKGLNERQAVYIQTKKAIKRQLTTGEGRGVAGTGIGMYDLLLGGVGTGIGVAAGQPLAGLVAVGVRKSFESPVVLTGISKMANYFNSLSPTKKLMFYNALKGLTAKSSASVDD